MRLFVVVDHLGEILAGNVQPVGDVVVTHRENHFLGLVLLRAIVWVDGMGDERAVLAGDSLDALVLADVELVVIGDAAVIFERLGANGLIVQRGHGNIADFEQLGRGEEHHVVGVVVDGVDDAALVDQDRAHAAPLEFDAAGEAGGSGADDDDVERFHF